MERAAPEFDAANRTYAAYAGGELGDREAVRRARAAQRAIADARDALTVLDPPKEAQRLHDGLVRYLDVNVEVARETTLLATYVPAAARRLEPLGAANRRLQAGLADAEEAGQQAAALRRFGGAVETTLRELRRLEPPAVLVTAHAEQVRRLAVTAGLAERLRRALLAQDAGRVAELLARFRATSDTGGPRRRLERGARAAYTRRLEAINEAYAQVQRAQVALDRSLR